MYIKLLSFLGFLSLGFMPAHPYGASMPRLGNANTCQTYAPDDYEPAGKSYAEKARTCLSRPSCSLHTCSEEPISCGTWYTLVASAIWWPPSTAPICVAKSTTAAMLDGFMHESRRHAARTFTRSLAQQALGLYLTPLCKSTVAGYCGNENIIAAMCCCALQAPATYAVGMCCETIFDRIIQS